MSLRSKLTAALALPGCPVCRLVADAFDAFYDRLALPGALEEATLMLARSGGFCQAHGWEAVRRLPRPVLAQLLGAALAGRRATAERLVEAALQPATSVAAYRAVRKAKATLAPLAPCPPCAVEAAVAEAGVQALLAALSLEQARASYRASDGLCVRHARQALARAARDSVPLLVERLTVPLATLSADIELYYHKETWEFSRGPKGAEQNAWLRGVERWVGTRRAARGSGA